LILIDPDPLDAAAEAGQTSAQSIANRVTAPKKKRRHQELPCPPTAPSLPIFTVETSARLFFGNYNGIYITFL